MLKGLGFLAVRAFLLFLLATPAWAVNDTLYINSQPGDYIGGGQQSTYTDSNGTFTATPKSTNGIALTFTGPTQASSWTLSFSAPVAGPLAVGNYDNAQYPALDPLTPSIYISPLSNVCDEGATGRFVVRAITTDGSGNITSFAADFVQTCGRATGSLTGAIRFNSSIPVAVDAPTADAGVNQLVQQGATVQLDGSLSLPGNGSITAYIWTQLSGPSVSLSDAAIVNPTFTAPVVPLGGADVVLQLEVDNSLALSSLSTVSIHVANPSDPLTIFTDIVDPGSLISASPASLDPLQAQFTVDPLTFGGDGVSVSANGGSNNSLSATFAAPTGQTLQIGTYDGAERYPFQSLGLPGLDFGSCNLSNGRFTILDLQKDGNGNVTSFAADFDQHCENQAPAAHGKVRFNSTIPLDAPVADIAPVETMVQGETVTLSAGSWSTGTDGDDITSYQWAQVSGPSVSLSDPSAADPTFVAPDVSPGGTDVVFQLTVTNSLGISSSTTVTVHISNPADVNTLLHLEVTSGGAQSGSSALTITSSQEIFTPSTATAGWKMQIGTSGTETEWQVVMSAPIGSSLQVGAYNNALSGLPIYPVLGVSNFLNGGAVFSCPSGGTVTGRFVVLALQTDGSGNLQNLAADFDEYCSSNSTTFHGVLRYNSSLPLDTPEADAGGKQEALPGAVVTLPATASYAGGDGDIITAYQWTQLSGPPITLSDATAAAPTFTAPSVPTGGADLVFQLTVTNSNGLTGTDTATVHVFNSADPRTLLHIKSDAGDPLGQGQTYDYNELNALFAPAVRVNPASGVMVTYGPNQANFWQMEFAPTIVSPTLQIGPYDDAQAYIVELDAQPGINVTGGFGGCGFDITGRFDILDLQRDQFGNITALAADFLETCTGATGSLHGQLRYNSAVPLNVPFADAGAPQQLADPGSVVTLGGSNSDPGADGATISSYQWVQLSGPSVTLSDPSGATTTFTSPDVPLGGADLTFQLTVTNSDGVSSTSTVTVHIGNPNDAKTRLYAKSDPQDPSGRGQTFDLRPTNALFSVSSTSSNGAANNAIRFTATTGAEESGNNWSVFMEAPTGQSLKVGMHYAFSPFQSGLPSFGAGPSDSGDCGAVSGLFVIRDLKTDQNGNITNFAADFIQHCYAGVPALVGWVRYNSTVPIDTPIADAGTAQSTYSGFPITLDGSDSRAAPNETFSYNWTQVVAKGDPVITLSDHTVAKPLFLAPDVALGGRTVTFNLTTTSNTGLTDSNTVGVTIGSEDDPKTVFYFESDQGDPLGNGNSDLVLSSNGYIDLDGYATNAFADLEIYDSAPATPLSLGFYFNPPYSSPMTAGSIYTNLPGSYTPLQINANGATCNNPDATFIVRDIATDSNGRLKSLGVDLIVHCSGATGSLRAALRYNSKTPILINEPTAAPGPNRNVTQAGTITLDGSTSFPGWGTIVSSQWKQVGGPRVILTNANTATANFNLPEKMFANGGNTLVFQLTVKNSLGLSSTNNVAITANEPPYVALYLQSDAGDPIGNGWNATYGFTPTSVKLQSQNMLSVSAALSGDGDWTLDFASPVKQTLAVGIYPNAILFKRTRGPSPEMDVSTAAAQCKTVTGSFTVLDVLYGMGDKIDSLAVDFVQHCNGIGPALHGKFRYHSAVP